MQLSDKRLQIIIHLMKILMRL